MIDPDNIILAPKNDHTNVSINQVPDCDYIVYDYEDDKDLVKFYKDVESQVRRSFEYREMIQFLRNNFGMDQCAFLKVSNKDNYNIKIEIHHYPFTLYDIVTIIYNKRCYYQETLDLQMVAKECTMLHYKLMVGLISLSKTVHQLVHAGKLFIPVNNVLGRYNLFINTYKPFCTAEQLETINRIEKYSRENSDLYNTSILDTNNITVSSTKESFKIPNFDKLETHMYNRIDDIKKNNYRLPKLEEYSELDKKDDPKDRRSITCPIFFYNE